MVNLAQLAQAFQGVEDDPSFVRGIAMIRGQDPNAALEQHQNILVKRAQLQAQQAQAQERQRAMAEAQRKQQVLGQVQHLFADMSGEEVAATLLQAGFTPEEAYSLGKAHEDLRPKVKYGSVTDVGGNTYLYNTSDRRDVSLLDPEAMQQPVWTGYGADIGMAELPELAGASGRGMEPLPPPPPGLSPKGEEQWNKEQAKLRAEKQAARPKVEARISSALQEMQDSIALSREAEDAVDWGTAGFFGDFLREWGGTDAADLEQTLETLKARSGLNALQEIRDNSPTGGALGNVSNFEVGRLEAKLRSLAQKQGPEQLRKNIKEFRQLLKQSQKRIQDAYKEEYGVEFKTPEQAPSGGMIDQNALDAELKARGLM